MERQAGGPAGEVGAYDVPSHPVNHMSSSGRHLGRPLMDVPLPPGSQPLREKELISGVLQDKDRKEILTGLKEEVRLNLFAAIGSVSVCRKWDTPIGGCYGLNCVPSPSLHAEVLTPQYPECDLILREDLHRSN